MPPAIPSTGLTSDDLDTQRASVHILLFLALVSSSPIREHSIPALEVVLVFITIYLPDLGRFRLRSRNQTTIPTPIPESESESESFVVRFGGVGIGVGIVVIGIGIGVRGDWNRSWNRNQMTIPHIYVHGTT